MEINVYREEIKKTFITDDSIALWYSFFKLVGELAEVKQSIDTRDEELEVGDVLYYLFQILNLLEIEESLSYDQSLFKYYEAELWNFKDRYEVFDYISDELGITWEKLGKSLRKNDGITEDFKRIYFDFAQKVFSILDYYTVSDTRYTLSDAMDANIEKLTERMKNGTIKTR